MEQEVKPIEEFNHLSGGSETARSHFKENLLSFAVSYGLCVQGLGKSELRTNLLPEEIVRKRLIRAKKPWAVAGAAAILLGLTFNYSSHVAAWNATQDEAMKQAETQAENVSRTSANSQSESSSIRDFFQTVKQTGDNLVSNVEGRLEWLELIKAVSAAMPRDVRPADERKETTEDISNRNELHFEALDGRYYADLESEWSTDVEDAYLTARGLQTVEQDDAESFAEEPAVQTDDGEEGVSLSGPGWVIQLTGYHYHNLDRTNDMARFVNNTLIKSLEEGSVELPDGENGELIPVLLRDVGISHPWVVAESQLVDVTIDPEVGMLDNSSSRRYGGGEGYGEFGGRGEEEEEEKRELIKLKRYDFVVQFCWIPTTKSTRKVLVEERLLREAERAAAEQEAADGFAEDAASIE